MLFQPKGMMVLDADTGNGGGGADGQSNDNTTPKNFELWLGEQPDDVKTLLEGHTQGLRTALQKEREDRKKFERELRDTAKKLDAGSDAQNQLTQIADKLAIAERQSAFFEAAHSAGISNLRLAYVAASEAGLVNDRGECDFGKLKDTFPELFTRVVPKGDAGAGQNGATRNAPQKSMNNFIRAAAGRGS